MEKRLSALQVSDYKRNNQVREKHRREVLLHIIAPVAATAIILALVVIFAVIVATPRQFDVIASFMSLLILVPSVVVLLIPFLLVIAIFYGIRRLYLSLSIILEKTRNVTRQVSVTTRQLSYRVAQPVIWLNEKVAWLEHFRD
jgi:hypothetical protein